MNKKNFILGGILVVLIALAYLYDGPIKDWQNNSNKQDNFFANLDFSQVSYIEIKDSVNTTALEKTGDKWKIAGTKEFYVKDDVISSVETAIAEAKKAEVELAGEKAENKGDFNTDEVGGVEVVFKQANSTLLEFVIGRMGGDYNSTYVSRKDDNNTYLIKTNIRGAFARGDWMNREIFTSDKEKINKIRFQYPTREFTIEKNEEGEWSGVLPYVFQVDNAEAEEVAGIMANLIASKVPAQTFEGTGLEKNSIIVQATGDGIDHTIMIGDPESDEEAANYFAKRGDSDNIYLISNTQKDTLDRTITSFR